MNTKSHSVFAALSSLCSMIFLSGCSKVIIFDPKGPVGEYERFVIIAAFLLVLLVVIPVVVMTFWFPLKYRASNGKAPYDPTWTHSAKIEVTMWVVPIVIVVALSILTWRATYHLDPYKPLQSEAPPLEVEVVSMDWKWLFIYPKERIAVVNQLVFPARAPVNFRVTSDTVMTSFFIPQLGSQIYAMPGMKTQLHLMADAPGVYAGQNQQFSGRGFSEMGFQAIATSKDDFEAWVQKARQSPDKLDFARFDELSKPSMKNKVAYFSSIDPDLFEHIIAKFTQMKTSPGNAGGNMPPPHGKPGNPEGN